ncbi:hypothetical protein OIDMADRAFT_27373 [Oidiodendron maius Zn]|uniref:Uncharacterized protein n=1 Tax=Oidiodendron maius (strain Zn) TaxID=913774 RepID=A0A0C3DLH7_OIDMZ|nr:hypothetical protein OIDMADRAFT_27373 [Oidiodendron maius Zn]
MPKKYFIHLVLLVVKRSLMELRVITPLGATTATIPRPATAGFDAALGPELNGEWISCPLGTGGFMVDLPPDVERELKKGALQADSNAKDKFMFFGHMAEMTSKNIYMKDRSRAGVFKTPNIVAIVSSRTTPSQLIGGIFWLLDLCHHFALP